MNGLKNLKLFYALDDKNLLDYVSALLEKNGVKRIFENPFITSEIIKVSNRGNPISINISQNETYPFILITEKGIHVFYNNTDMKLIVDFTNFVFDYVDRKERKLIIEIDGVDMSYAIAFKALAEYMQTLGNIGSSRSCGIFADGDGSFRPKVNIIYPIPIIPYDASKFVKTSGDMYIDPDTIAWEIYH